MFLSQRRRVRRMSFVPPPVALSCCRRDRMGTTTRTCMSGSPSAFLCFSGDLPAKIIPRAAPRARHTLRKPTRVLSHAAQLRRSVCVHSWLCIASVEMRVPHRKAVTSKPAEKKTLGIVVTRSGLQLTRNKQHSGSRHVGGLQCRGHTYAHTLRLIKIRCRWDLRRLLLSAS